MEEIHRLNILEQVEEGALSLISGTEVLKISYRHGKRLLARYRRDGPEGLAHKRRGRRAHNAFDPAIREHVIKLHQERYPKFNDTHFVEMLEEREGLRISRETVRCWLREAEISVFPEVEISLLREVLGRFFFRMNTDVRIPVLYYFPASFLQPPLM